MNDNTAKDQVKKKYGEIASGQDTGCGCGCGPCCSSGAADYSHMSDDYTFIDGYVPDADLHLGCGIPTRYADIQEGDIVVDLGSGAGNDAFIVRRLVGESGRVIGIDMTPEMIQNAEKNNRKMGYLNVEFILADIDDMPLEDESADVVVSNCVLNLVPDKNKAFAEIFRILRPGGHFCISDIVLQGKLPETLVQAAELYTGCISGAVQEKEYIDIIDHSGFSQVEIRTRKEIRLPPELLRSILDEQQLQDFQNATIGIFSVTVTGGKQ